MSDFGGKLRQARERRGISLRQIAATTKISVAALEALERNDISKLPGGIFSRAFVRSYALEVGLDPEETVKEFLERFHGESVSTPAAAPAVVPEHESSFESQQRMASVVLKLIVVSVPLVALILYFTLRGRSAADPAEAPGAVAEQPAAQPQTPAIDSPRSPAAAPPQRAGELTLALHPTAECWVTLTVDGERIFSRVMQPGERELRQVRQEAVIQIGDAGAFAYSINGRPGRALGETGQVRTARITPENVAEYIR